MKSESKSSGGFRSKANRLWLTLRSFAGRVGGWVRYQLVETWREAKRDARPPVKVRRQAGGALAIATRPEFGGGVVVLPVVGSAAQVRINENDLAELVVAKPYLGDGATLARTWCNSITSGAGGRNEYVVTTAHELVWAYAEAMVALRDSTGCLLTHATLREGLGFEAIYRLAENPAIPEDMRGRLMRRIRATPTFSADRGALQSQTTLEQHAYFAGLAVNAIDRAERDRTEGRGGIEVVSNGTGEFSRSQFVIGRFTDRATAEQCVSIISKALTAGEMSFRRLAGVTAVAIAGLFVWAALFGPKGPASVATAQPRAEVSSSTAKSAGRGGGSLISDAFGSSPGTEISPAEGAGTGSLADQIYEQARAASDREAYRAGPPQGPTTDPAMGDFGLGTSGKEGCDPALAFTVSQ